MYCNIINWDDCQYNEGIMCEKLPSRPTEWNSLLTFINRIDVRCIFTPHTATFSRLPIRWLRAIDTRCILFGTMKHCLTRAESILCRRIIRRWKTWISISSTHAAATKTLTSPAYDMTWMHRLDPEKSTPKKLLRHQKSTRRRRGSIHTCCCCAATGCCITVCWFVMAFHRDLSSDSDIRLGYQNSIITLEARDNRRAIRTYCSNHCGGYCGNDNWWPIQKLNVMKNNIDIIRFRLRSWGISWLRTSQSQCHQTGADGWETPLDKWPVWFIILSAQHQIRMQDYEDKESDMLYNLTPTSMKKSIR